MSDSWFACSPWPRRVVATDVCWFVALGRHPPPRSPTTNRCSGIDNRSAFQRALAADCETGLGRRATRHDPRAPRHA